LDFIALTAKRGPKKGRASVALKGETMLVGICLFVLAFLFWLTHYFKDSDTVMEKLSYPAMFFTFLLTIFVVWYVIRGQMNGIADIEHHTELTRMISEEGRSDEHMEDIYGQVSALNQKLAKEKRYNKMFFLDSFYHDQWCSMQPIALPERGKSNGKVQ
jgi:hypothetical protein